MMRVRREMPGKAKPTPHSICPYGACIDHLVSREIRARGK
jgi:hypothetical protein